MPPEKVGSGKRFWDLMVVRICVSSLGSIFVVLVFVPVCLCGGTIGVLTDLSGSASTGGGTGGGGGPVGGWVSAAVAPGSGETAVEVEVPGVGFLSGVKKTSVSDSESSKSSCSSSCLCFLFFFSKEVWLSGSVYLLVGIDTLVDFLVGFAVLFLFPGVFGPGSFDDMYVSFYW